MQNRETKIYELLGVKSYILLYNKTIGKLFDFNTISYGPYKKLSRSDQISSYKQYCVIISTMHQLGLVGWISEIHDDVQTQSYIQATCKTICALLCNGYPAITNRYKELRLTKDKKIYK